MIGDLIVLDLAVLALLIAFSALLNGAEAAYFSLGRARLKRMREGPDANHTPIPLIDRPNELLLTCDAGAFDRLSDGLARATGTRLQAIGTVTGPGSGVSFVDARGRAVAAAAGFEHFVTGARR